MLRISKNRRIKSPTTKIEASTPLLLFANKKEKKKKRAKNKIVNRKIAGSILD